LDCGASERDDGLLNCGGGINTPFCFWPIQRAMPFIVSDAEIKMLDADVRDMDVELEYNNFLLTIHTIVSIMMIFLMSFSLVIDYYNYKAKIKDEYEVCSDSRSDRKSHV
jgi:hypothetical protein